MKPERAGTPVLVTRAAPYEVEFVARRRKYLTVMLVRMSFVVVAGVLHGVWWLAVAFVLLSVPLPWVAGLAAVDRTPCGAEEVSE